MQCLFPKLDLPLPLTQMCFSDSNKKQRISFVPMAFNFPYLLDCQPPSSKKMQHQNSNKNVENVETTMKKYKYLQLLYRLFNKFLLYIVPSFYHMQDYQSP